MTRARQEPPCPSLPPEIWITILTHHTDLLHLWTACRLVSRSLRACTERAFPLHEMDINFQLEKYNLGGRQRRPEVPVRFDRMCKNEHGEEIAVFRDKRTRDEILREDCDGIIVRKLIGKRRRNGRSVTPGAKSSAKEEVEREQYCLVMARWEENILWPKPELPNYTISLRGMVNDTALPGLALDRAERSVSFEWKRAVSAFVREEEYVRDMMQGIQRKDCTDTAKMTAKNHVEAEQNEPASKHIESPMTIHMSLSSESAIRIHVRRTRLKQHYARDELMCWAIESLKHFESHGSPNAGTAKAMRVNLQLPGAGLGERWWGRTNVVQELYLDEWSCIQRIDMRRGI